MWLQIVTGFFLLVSAVTGTPVTVNRIRDNKGAADNMHSNEYFTDMFVFDNDGNPVKIDFDTDYEESVEEIEDLPNRVLFYLYTRETRDNPEQLYLNDVATLENSNFSPKKETKIVAHGWMNSHRSKASVLVRDAFLQHGDYNVIAIDWSFISKSLYSLTIRCVLIVSKFAAQMIDFLQEQEMNPSHLTIVGHSLGGHIAGLSARYAKGKVNYVVALDPALPKFGSEGPGTRVSRGDANFVEVIHTNAGLLGYDTAIGDADFYPNGGKLQKGCIIKLIGCSHSLSYEYYAESINSNIGFLARNCTSYDDFLNGKCDSNGLSFMGGIKTNFNMKGKYYLETNKNAPFALGKV